MTEAIGIRPSSYTQDDADELVRQFEALDRENFFKEFGYYPGTLVRDPISLKAHKFLTDQGAATLVYQGEADFDDGDPENGPGDWGYPDYDLYHSECQDIVIEWRGMFISDVSGVAPFIPPDFPDEGSMYELVREQPPLEPLTKSEVLRDFAHANGIPFTDLKMDFGGEWAGLGGPYSRIDHWSKRWPRCECWLCRMANGDPDAGTED